MQSTNLHEGGKIQRCSRSFTSHVLANFVVFYHMWQNDMCGSDWS